MRKILLYISMPVIAGGLLSACVTINIYFPAAAAEKAADKIIEEVWQLDRENEAERDADDAERHE